MIYLKSTELEPSSLRSPGETPGRVTSCSEISNPQTFSCQTILKQATADLKHTDPKVRILAIRYLEKADPCTAMPLLQEILSDRDPRVREQAISSLIKFRSSAVSPWIKKCLRDSDPGVRIAALRGMFKNRGPIDLNILLQFLSDESAWVRRKVATLLGWTPMEGVLPILTALSKDQDSKVRQAALFSLITLYPEESEDRLVEAMSDPDPDLRKWARSTLERMIAKPLKGRKASRAYRG